MQVNWKPRVSMAWICSHIVRTGKLSDSLSRWSGRQIYLLYLQAVLLHSSVSTRFGIRVRGGLRSAPRSSIRSLCRMALLRRTYGRYEIGSKKDNLFGTANGQLDENFIMLIRVKIKFEELPSLNLYLLPNILELPDLKLSPAGREHISRTGCNSITQSFGPICTTIQSIDKATEK